MPQNLVSAKVAYNKNHLRPLILFLIEKRQSVVGDSDFSFSVKEYAEFINNQYKYPFAPVTFLEVKNNLDLLCMFKRRDGSLKIINPEKPLLIYKIDSDKNFNLSECYTEYLTNVLRFIEHSIFLDKDGKPLEKECSFFGLDKHNKITFMSEPFNVNLGKKEEAIFNYLRKRFNKECGYRDLFKSVLVYKKDDPRVKKILDKERAGYIRDGINEIRKKLYEVSGYRLAIETVNGRESIFKLVY